MIKFGYLLFFISACSLGMWACTDRKEKYINLQAEQFESLLRENMVQLLDVRTPEEFAEGFIPGSININVTSDSFSLLVDEKLSKEIPVALYCRSGRRSRKAAQILTDKGYKVYHLEKGYQRWIEEGREVEGIFQSPNPQ
ncbi:MAG: rhodanese-like domain-containing protein [Phocaeicola sp.]